MADSSGLPPVTGLDPGIAFVVEAFRDQRIATFESCEGGPDHAYGEPTVAFRGCYAEGFRALAVALALGFPVRDLQRVWKVIQGEPGGPIWEMTFSRARSSADPVDCRPECSGS